MELGRGKIYLNDQPIGEADGVKVFPASLAFENFRLGGITKARNVTISLQAVEYSFDNLIKTFPEVARSFRRFRHAWARGTGRKPFYRKRRTRSIRGK